MSKLPFVVQPRLKPVKERIGTEETGILEIERRGYLTAGEKGFMQVQFSSDLVTKSMLALVRDISRAFSIDQEDAYQELQRCLGVSGATDLGIEILDKFKEELDELAGMMVEVQSRRRLVAAFCMIIYRINESITFDEFCELHPDLIEQLADLFEDEEKRSLDRVKAGVEGADVGDSENAETLEKK